MTEFSFTDEQHAAFIDELHRRELPLSEISEAEIALNMFKRFLDGDPYFDVPFPEFEATQPRSQPEIAQPIADLEVEVIEVPRGGEQ